ncbi:hypothetical protein P154DRAFT_476564 [Amniculicola lignicola CBS 123094]|uniref:ORC6 first cyclin-like domain-containing protein n=1 Tax=Amniculicola lignicola CBS 123094 TaxID=1392246 RepID=A0A6A5VZF4_9PLEO|nr:hypothetical protein P154DRAFT_476564 [Amniculicola lignicola CBS 123094]
MSRAGIEQALTGLIPTLNGPLPPDLIELSLSLLARSRSVAQSLKQDEEIARPYACAQLACERLKKRLNLPAITSRPPCPPRIYKKLYTYLESALPAPTSTRAPETPRKNATQASASARTTPKTPLSGRRTPRSTAKANGKADDAPDWIMPTIRTLVKTFKYPMAAPHVFTGVESTIPLLARMAAAAAETPSKRSRRTTTAPPGAISDLTTARILGLVAVMFFYVLSQMLDQDISPEQFTEWREKAVATLLQMSVSKDCTEDMLYEEIEALMPMAHEEGWLQMEWYTNIEPVDDGDQMEGVELTGGKDTSNGSRKDLRNTGSEYIGLGTMMQEATDYLGVRQREDYKRWKTEIMARVEEIEAA